MKMLRVFAVLAFALVSLPASSTLCLAQSGTHSDAQKVLDKFKSMAGTWQGKSAAGDTSEGRTGCKPEERR